MTPTFRVTDKHTGREYSEENINTDGLMEMDLDQMYLGEDGTLVMADDCDRIAYQDCERFDVLIDGYVPIDRVLEIINKEIDDDKERVEKAVDWDTAEHIYRSIDSMEIIRDKVLELKGDINGKG